MTNHPDPRRPRVTRDEALEAAARAWMAVTSCSNRELDAGAVARRRTFAPGIDLLTTPRTKGGDSATLILEVCRDVTAGELRVLAERYERFPAWLRDRADELDAQP
ncbi:hypothetical protein [Microbacterium aquimaris]|uniref:Uncharacterized protein n=1 Tax=Microbacterium aquimaris TaxID=459816 RepID=A0ABU5N7S2_9MICO|nr:hypothetical protein [Microbacterium aquimaris]MDZ8161997.1 hypothetical protein [Microbacterium aquimaris]